MLQEILNLEGYPNCITISKITAILLNGGILPFGGASSGRVCAQPELTPKPIQGRCPIGHGRFLFLLQKSKDYSANSRGININSCQFRHFFLRNYNVLHSNFLLVELLINLSCLLMVVRWGGEGSTAFFEFI